MDRRLRLHGHRGFHAIALSILLLPGLASAQMSLDELIITSGPAYQNGAFTDFFIDPVVFGNELAAVSVTISAGLTIDFVEVDEDEFACDEAIPGAPCEDFVSLAEINAIGDLTFNVSGENGESDSWVVPAADYAPGAGQAGFPVITSPTSSQDVFSPGAAFEWGPAPGWVDAIQVDLVDVLTDTGVDEALFFGNAATSWAPANAVAGRDYDFDISFFEIFFLEDARSTSGGRAYAFTSGFQAFNRKRVPEPSGALGLVLGALALAASTRRVSRRGDAKGCD